MSRCVNENCGSNPAQSMDMVIATCDGDMACDNYCKSKFIEQRDRFFNEAIKSHEDLENWLNE